MTFTGSMVALITPMQKDGQVDFEGLTRLVDWQIQSGTAGLVINGTTGEAATLSAEEQFSVLQHVVEQVDGRIPVIAGTGTNNTAVTIARTKQANRLAIAACLVVTPYYNKPTQAGMYQHYQQVAEASRTPILLYNVPGRTGCDLLPETVARLAQLPNIVGIKDASPDPARITALTQQVSADFVLLSGEDPAALAFMQAGGHGVISVTANVVPAWMAALCAAACQHRDPARAASLDAVLQPLHQALFIESNPIPTKWLLSQIKQTGPGIRLPLLPLSSHHHATVMTAYEAVQAQASLLSIS